jgi:hypothetical protein
LLIKNNETLRAYRIRLRALLDSQFSVNISKSKPKSPENNTNLIQLKLNQLKTRKKISLLKPVEEKTRTIRVYKPIKDPYFVGNLLSRQNFTSFQVLLNLLNEQVSVFPYSKINPSTVPAEVKLENFKRKTAETLKTFKSPSLKLEKIKEIREKYSWVKRIYFNIQKVDCMTKAFIVNLPCVFDKSGFLDTAVESFRLLEGHVHLILVIPSESLLVSVTQSAERWKIAFSAIYSIESKENNKKIKKNQKLLDYSAIFLDFHCFEPSEDCLIFAVHDIEDFDGMTQDEMIGLQVGSSVKLFVQNIPLNSQEFSKQPVTVLMFQTEIDQDCENLLKAAEIFLGFLRFNFSLRNNFNLTMVLKESNWDLVESCLPCKASLMYETLIQCYRGWNEEGRRKGFLFNFFVY